MAVTFEYEGATVIEPVAGFYTDPVRLFGNQIRTTGMCTAGERLRAGMRTVG